MGLPPGRNIELLAEAGGLLQGRFLLTPGPETRLGLEQRLVAIGLADQAGAALAGAWLAGQRQAGHSARNFATTGLRAAALIMCVWPGSSAYRPSGKASATRCWALRMYAGLLPPAAMSTCCLTPS